MKKLILLSLLLLPLHTLAEQVYVNNDWLSKNLTQKDLVVIDMSEDPQYQRFHIPGAVQLPYHVLNHRTRQGVSLSIGSQKIAQLLGLLGITPTTNIIIYDDMGGLHAARLYWELDRIGHPQKAILNGGLVQWILTGKPVNNTPVQPKAVAYTLQSGGVNNLASLDDLQNSNSVLVDVRTEEEYLGQAQHKRSGHVPGARWWEWQQAVDFERGFVLKAENELVSSLQNILGKDKQRAVTLYCQSGHRAAHSYTILRQLGYNNVRVYDGSMAEYQQQANLPLKLGNQP